MPASVPSRLTVRNVQLLRALFAALVALMITFSPDHSYEIGLAAFGGFGIATALVFCLAAWLGAPAMPRGSSALLAAVYLVAGMAASVVNLRSDGLFFGVVIAWALVAGLVELLVGITQRTRLGRTESRDAIVIGALTMLLGVAVLLVPVGYSLEYYIEDAGRSFTLTGTVIAVGLLGGYAAIAAVYLAIAGLSPQPDQAQRSTPATDIAAPEAARAATAPEEDRQ